MSETKKKKKRHHYVPKFILRKFTPNENTISLFAFKAERKILEASLKEQCYSDYFYGMESTMEDAFATSEGEFSKIIADLSSEHIEKITEENLTEIRLFVHFQKARTMGAAKEINQMNDDLMRNLFVKFIEKNRHLDPRLVDLKKEDIDGVHLKTSKPQYTALSESALTAPVVLDLKVKFLLNKESIGFIISDNPVVFQNQWAEHHPKFKRYLGITGLASKGLQMFMPLSPQICLVLFDSTTYEYGKSGDRLCSIGKLDVERINTLQAVNSFDCIYYNNQKITDAEIKKMCCKRKEYSESKSPMVSDMGIGLELGEQPSETIAMHSKDLRIGAKFSFIRVVDRNLFEDYRLAYLPVRNPSLVKFTEYYRERLQRERATDLQPASM